MQTIEWIALAFLIVMIVVSGLYIHFENKEFKQ